MKTFFSFVYAVNFVVQLFLDILTYMTEALAARKPKLFFICYFDRPVPRCLAWLAERTKSKGPSNCSFLSLPLRNKYFKNSLPYVCCGNRRMFAVAHIRDHSSGICEALLAIRTRLKSCTRMSLML